MSTNSVYFEGELRKNLKALKIKNTYKGTIESINELLGTIEPLLNEIREKKTNLETKYRELFLYEALSDTIANCSKTVSEIFVKNTNRALGSNESNEYNIAGWKEQLLSIVSRKDFFSIKLLSYTDKNLWIDVDKSKLGTIEDYGKIVAAVREKMNYGGGKMKNGLNVSPEMASRIWKLTYQLAREGATWTRKASTTKKGVNRKEGSLKKASEKAISFYWSVMQSRLDEMQNKAPFWYILEYGNSWVKLSSDKGGTPYPVVSSTRFISISTTEAELFINNYFNTKFSQYKKEIETLKNVREQYNLISNTGAYLRSLRNILLEGEGFVEREPSHGGRLPPQEGVAEILGKKIKDGVRLAVDARLSKIKKEATNMPDKQRELRILDARMAKISAQLLTGEIVPGKQVYVGRFQGKDVKRRTIRLHQELVKLTNEITPDKDIAAHLLTEYFTEIKKIATETIDVAIKAKKASRVKKGK